VKTQLLFIFSLSPPPSPLTSTIAFPKVFLSKAYLVASSSPLFANPAAPAGT